MRTQRSMCRFQPGTGASIRCCLSGPERHPTACCNRVSTLSTPNVQVLIKVLRVITKFTLMTRNHQSRLGICDLRFDDSDAMAQIFTGAGGPATPGNRPSATPIRRTPSDGA